MFATPRRLSAFCICLVVINAAALLLGYLYLSTLDISYTVYLIIMCYLITTTLVSILLTIGVWDMSRQLELEFNTTAVKLHNLSEKMTELEKQIKAK